MKPPIIVNESSQPDTPGDLMVFNSIGALETYLEPWYVDEPHFIYDCEGTELEIQASKHGVRLLQKSPLVRNIERVRLYFEAFLGKGQSSLAGETLSELAQQSTKIATG
ncbi:MAG: hypothetical protein AAGJ29_00950 [Pseudomonadota bacterium]